MMGNKPIPVILVTLALSSIWAMGCSEDEGPAEPKKEPDVVGIWALSKMHSEYEGGAETLSQSQIDSMGVIWILKMNSNGTAEQTTNISGATMTMPGTWKTEGDKLTLVLIGPTGEPGTLEFDYVIEGNTLKLDWSIQAGTKYNAEFTRQ